MSFDEDRKLTAHDLLPLAERWLRVAHPSSVIVREMSVGHYGSARIDVAAITKDKIVGVEIKGDGDSTARLDRQGLAYGMVAKEMWLLPSPHMQDKAVKSRPPGWGMLEVFSGVVRPMNIRKRVIGERKTKGVTSFIYGRDDASYAPHAPDESCAHLSVRRMCETLWRDELIEISERLGLSKLTGMRYVHDLWSLIEREVPTTLMHEQMIIQLRKRDWMKSVSRA